MIDPRSPTPDELRLWASVEGAVEPMPDWELFLASEGLAKTYIEIAAEPAYPMQEYFLDILYFMVGREVNSDRLESRRSIVEGWLECGESTDCTAIRTWAERGRRLLRDPGSFDYEFWCGGGHLTS